MKILFAEKVLKVLGKGSYEYCYSEDGTMMFLDIKSESACIFDDDIRKIKNIFRSVKGNKVQLQYISVYLNDNKQPKIKLCCVVF